MSSEPRAHHFSPQCWLAGFTEGGSKDETFYVTDLKRKKQWRSNPLNTGHQRDFYRVSQPEVDPNEFERLFGRIETRIAPVLKDLFCQVRPPTAEELDSLLLFAAIQFIRIPAFRPFVLRISDEIVQAELVKALASPELWSEWLRKMDISPMQPGADYQSMVDFQQNVLSAGKYSLEAENEYFLEKGFTLAENSILPCLRERHWKAICNPQGTFIGSDYPVSFDGPRNQQIGFKNADAIFISVNRFLRLMGTNKIVGLRYDVLTSEFVARQNTFSMITAAEQLYSHAPNFCWLDGDSKGQNDWRLFDKEELLEKLRG